MKIIINAIIYIVLTTVLLYLWKNEKKIGDLIREKRDIFSNKVIDKFKVKKEKSKTNIKKTVSTVETITSAVLLVLLIQHFYIGNFLVPTGSMIPTIVPGDRMFGDMVTYKFKQPNRGDIIVFKEPIDDKVLFTKRLIGLPGEKVKISKETNSIYIDGVKIRDKKLEREYYADGSLGEDEWIIPKKGDKISLKDIKLKLGTRTLSLPKLREELKSNKISFENIDEAKMVEFLNNQKVKNDGSLLYGLSLEDRKKLLLGETVKIGNKKIIMTKFKCSVYSKEMEFEELSKLSKDEIDKLGDNFSVERMSISINGIDKNELIIDKDIVRKLLKDGELTLSEDYYFALGDNSGNSKDSRYWGFVAHRIKGKPILRFWPLNRIGLVK